MVNPIKAAQAALQPITSAVGRAFTLPSGLTNGPPAPDVPAPPPLAPEASSPSAKPARKGQQSSFLSGVAASSLAGQSSGGGKTLLGA